MTELATRTPRDIDPSSQSKWDSLTPATPTPTDLADGLPAIQQIRVEMDTTEDGPVKVDHEEVNADVAVDVEPSEPSVEQTTPLLTAKSRIGRLLQRLSDRIENGAEHADTASEYLVDKKDAAKEALVTVGHTALGVGIISARAAGRGVATMGEKVGDGFVAGMQKVEAGMDKGANYVQGKVDAVKESIAERVQARRERAIERKNAALARKEARRAKWAARRDGVKEYGRYVREGYNESKEAAIALKEEQKRKIGHFAARARATGEAATSTWKSYPER